MVGIPYREFRDDKKDRAVRPDKLSRALCDGAPQKAKTEGRTTLVGIPKRFI
jgi:hypothetical protein